MRASLRAHDWQPIAGDQTVTGSFGVATSHARTATHLTLLQQADARLYLAKSSGRDRVIAQG